jgi:beta-galactosidase
VRVYSNCEAVELFLNGRSQGRKPMEKNSHLEWKAKYAPGTLLARGDKNGREILADEVETT